MRYDNVYIIGEIGQNHNGSVDLAKLIMEMAARPVKDELFSIELKPLDAVKLTKRDLNEELSVDMMSRPYDSPHSFGKTYGEHRRKLELCDEAHFELYKYAKSLGLEFVETLCAVGSMSVLKLFTPDYLKVASRDLTNIPLLDELASTGIPIIISTGMADQRDIDDAVSIILRHHEKITILHCTSEYPTQPKNVNLNAIPCLRKKYPNYSIGFSDHTVGISAAVGAVALGACFIEKHITIDRKMKGTDQAGSLGPDGLNRMIRDIRLMEMFLGKEEISCKEGVFSAKKKLERSIATRNDLHVGHIIKEGDIHLLSPGDGIKWRDRGNLIGKKLKVSKKADSIIYPQDLV